MTVEPPVATKPAVESRTVWLNTGIIVFVALALSIPEVSAIIPAVAQPYVVAAVAILNLFLRLNGTPAKITSLT
jgi:hypothetical protein